MSEVRQKMHTASSNTRQAHLSFNLRPWPFVPLLLILLLAPLSAMAQSADIASDGKEAEAGNDSSQHVEESEEAYRRRMETAESHDQADVMRPRSSGTGKAPEGIDALPADSRKHLRDELRNVIIEQGEWQPADANKVYPYIPSTAAEKDPELRQQEEKAWGELIAEYHKREAAALAAGGGRIGGSEPGEGQDGSGQQGQAGSSASSASGKSPSSPAERAATEAASGTAAGAGVSQSALEFLRGQAGGQPGGGNSTGHAGGQAGGQPAGQAGNQTANTAASAGQASSSAGQQQSPPEPQPQNAVAQAAADKPEENQQEKSDEEEPPPPPGSLAIAELVALEESAKQQAAEQVENSANAEANTESASSSTPQTEEQATPSITLQSSDQPPPPPGTIAIPELEKLQGMDESEPLAVQPPEKKTGQRK